ncbi:MAG: hypothetical protein EOM26_11295 [Alphaproteobacteria bacterium]|nr:hypothetical protein [Alphaproteobacteria bacterium]
MEQPMIAPCANLIERDIPECAVGRKVPGDCNPACVYYSPGLTRQEQIRAEAWAKIRQWQEDRAQ